jgi:hypothetical protein
LGVGLSTSRARANTGWLDSSSFYVSNHAKSSSLAREPIAWLGLGSTRAHEPVERSKIVNFFLEGPRRSPNPTPHRSPFYNCQSTAVLYRTRGGTKQAIDVVACVACIGNTDGPY